MMGSCQRGRWKPPVYRSLVTTRHAFSDGDLPLQVFHRPPGDVDAVAAQPAVELAAAARQLARGELGLLEARRPVRYERAMRRARHRVLRYALCRREKARDEVRFPARGGRDQRERIE